MRIDQSIAHLYDSAPASTSNIVSSKAQRSSSDSPISMTGDAASISLSSGDTLRQKRIEALTLQVQSGTYKVDAGAVASSMLAAHFGDN